MSEFTEGEYKKVSELAMLCQISHTFNYDGLHIEGERVTIVKEYVHENPSKEFRTWLIDKGYVIREL